MKVLWLEDDTLLGELVLEHLQDRGWEVDWFEHGERAEEALLGSKYDLLLLDINVPGIDGLELLQSMRDRHDMTPVVMITSRNTTQDLKKGFESGCDDYIKKPFDFEELDARIDHLVRRFGLQKEERLQIDRGLFFEPSAHRLIIDAKAISLTPKASEILHYLLKHQGRIVSKEELIQNVWSYEQSPSEATLRSYIKTLRKHLPNIVTERGVGYGFEPL